MDIRNSVEGLKTLLGVPSTAQAQTQPVKGGAVGGSAPDAPGGRPRHVKQCGNGSLADGLRIRGADRKGRLGAGSAGGGHLQRAGHGSRRQSD